MLTRQLILLSLACLVVSAVPLSGARADEGTASLDSMWIDQEAPTIDKDSDRQASSTVAGAGGVPSIVAPMCSFGDFRTSSLVSKGNWPGLGPFKASPNDVSEMTDERENHLKVNVKNEQVTSARLGLGKLGSGNVRDFLDIEMASDFLLESLGARPRKISEFNKLLEKNRGALKPGGAGISLAAGRYQVSIERSTAARPYSCLIAVNSLDAAKSVLAEHSAIAAQETPPDETLTDNKLALVGKKPPAGKAKPPSAINPTVDPRRDEFVSTIKAWQQIKKTALKKRDPAHLSDILYGTALSKQSTAVKWLQTHGNYYDMEPRGCAVDSYTDLGGGKKYSVVAQVREFSKYVRESDNAVLKEVDDKYTVDYTIEKVNDKWMITGSQVVNSNQPSQTVARPQSKTH
jgi:hypothetical protein